MTMLKSHVVNSIWGNVEASIDGYSNLIADCLDVMSKSQCERVLRRLRSPEEEVEACDVAEGQTVHWMGQNRLVESVKIDNGTVFTVEIGFEGLDTVKFTEGDYLTVITDDESEVQGALVTLKDHGDGGEPGFDDEGVEVAIQADERWIWIQIEGYGEASAQDGHGAPIGLEYYNGRLRLIVYNDINEQDPQIIDMEDARESNRAI